MTINILDSYSWTMYVNEVSFIISHIKWGHFMTSPETCFSFIRRDPLETWFTEFTKQVLLSYVEIDWRFCFTLWRAPSRLTCLTRVLQIRSRNETKKKPHIDTKKKPQIDLKKKPHIDTKKKPQNEMTKNVENCWFQEMPQLLLKFNPTKKISFGFVNNKIFLFTSRY